MHKIPDCYIKGYPRPQFVRENWFDLCGIWSFAFDDENIGEKKKLKKMTAIVIRKNKRKWLH